MRAALLLLCACAADKGAGPGPVDDTAQRAESGETGAPAEVESACAELRGELLEGEVCVSAAPCGWGGEQSYEYYGWAVASGHDVDGDGLDDLLLAAPAYDVPSSDGYGSDAGRVLLVTGGALAEPGDGLRSTLTGTSYAANLGTSVALVGDVDGDGLSEALLGAHGDDTSGENAGAAWLVSGDAAGWPDGGVDAAAHAVFRGESEYARAGRGMAGGDVDGDGLSDLLLGGELTTYDGEDEDFREGRAYLVLGDADLSTRSLADADARLDGPDAYGGAGKTTAIGDLNGDGYADALVAAPYGCSWGGCVYALPGRYDPSAWGGDLSEAPIRLEGEAAYDAFGWSVVVSDLDGDGLDDVVVGAPLSDRGYASGGAFWIYGGDVELFEGSFTGAAVDGPWDDWQLGAGLTAGGDLDGDGKGELLVGAVASWTGLHTKAGRYYLFRGDETRPGSVDDAAAIIHGGAVKDYLGSAAAMGDLDGDGRDDLAVASGYVNTETAYDIGAAWLFWGQ